MGEMVWADRPDGGQVRFDPDLCVRFPLPAGIEDHPTRYLYHESEGDLWIYAEERIEFRLEKGGSYHPAGPRLVPIVELSCRVVTRTEADGLFREAGKDFPPEWERVEREAETNPSEWEVDRQIIETLRAVGHRLTTDDLLAEAANRGLILSEHTVKRRLAALVRDKRLTSGGRGRGSKGYGLPDWE
jgi:hypothetical protein